jgi:hypothetical protein
MGGFSPRVSTARLGATQNSEHTAGVDGVLLTAPHKAASRAEALGLLLTTRKSGRRKQQGETPEQWRARSRGRRRSARWSLAGASRASEGGKGAVHGWENLARTAPMPIWNREGRKEGSTIEVCWSAMGTGVRPWSSGVQGKQREGVADRSSNGI